jgi:hypothetical protein
MYEAIQTYGKSKTPDPQSDDIPQIDDSGLVL